MGTIAAAALNPHRKRGAAPLQASDFMLKPPETAAQREKGLKGALRSASSASKRKRRK